MLGNNRPRAHTLVPYVPPSLPSLPDTTPEIPYILQESQNTNPLRLRQLWRLHQVRLWQGRERIETTETQKLPTVAVTAATWQRRPNRDALPRDVSAFPPSLFQVEPEARHQRRMTFALACIILGILLLAGCIVLWFHVFSLIPW